MSDTQVIEKLNTLQRRVEDIYIPEVPVQPLFSAYKSDITLNVTGDGTLYTVIFDTEVSDVGGNYNNANGIFTAPVTGKYLFAARALPYGFGASHTILETRLITSNRTYYGDRYASPFVIAGSSYQSSAVYAVSVDMDAADVAYFTLAVSSDTKTIDLYGAATYHTYFQGYLLI